MATKSKILALVVAAVWIVLAACRVIELGISLGVLIYALVMALAGIWFPEELGSYKETWGLRRIDKESPPIVVSIFSWIVLLGFPLLGWWAK